MQLRQLFLGNYGLGRAFLYSLIIKIVIFAIGITLMGVFASRTGLGSSSNSGGYQMFGLDQWPNVEAYTDFRDLYLKDLVLPFLAGHDAYQLGFIVYNYPPLFLYLLSFFAQLNLAWFPAIPLVAFDILTAIPVYLISKKFLFQGSAKIAFVLAIVWAANPINLFYNDLMWLNPGPTTFFLMMGIYYFLKKDWYFSAFMLAISTGFKQTSILVFPVLLVLLWRLTAPEKISKYFQVKKQFAFQKPNHTKTEGRTLTTKFRNPRILKSLKQMRRTFFSSLRKAASAIMFGLDLLKPLLYYLAIYVGFLFVISLPYVLTEPQNYFYSLELPIFGYPQGTGPGFPTQFAYDLSQPTRLTTFLGVVSFTNLQGLALSSYHILDYVFVFAYVSLIVYIVLAKFEPTGSNTLILAMAAFLVFFGLYGRGIYKYYFATVTPLAIPFFAEKRQALLFELISMAILLVPRVATPWMAVLLLTMLPRFLTQYKTQTESTVAP